jgi:hypothetical protein
MTQEINTGIFFPSALSQDSHLKLVGVGVRRKLVFHVYAFGLYLNTKDLYFQLKSQWNTASAEQMAADGKFWDALVSEEQDRAIVLVMYRKISGDLLNEAFNVSLMERIKQIGLTEASSKADTGSKAAKQKDEVEPLVALENFKKLFSDRNLSRNSKLTFHWQKGTFLGPIFGNFPSDQLYSHFSVINGPFANLIAISIALNLHLDTNTMLFFCHVLSFGLRLKKKRWRSSCQHRWRASRSNWCVHLNSNHVANSILFIFFQ